MNTNEKKHILFASAELAPFAKVGGLGDVAGALPQAIRALDPDLYDIRAIIPFHEAVKRRNPSCEHLGSFQFTTPSANKISCELYLTHNGDIPVYLLDNEHINHGSPIYHGDWRLDGVKYSSFSLALLHAMCFLNWHIDLLHANDWHTALAVYALKSLYANDPFFASTRTILSIHNLPFNGWGSQEAMSALGFPASQDPDLPDWARYVPMPLGLSVADKIIAVSPGYAAEILTPEYGCGLEGYLQKHSNKVMGILNGIDGKLWDPQSDPAIPANYSPADMQGKAENKSLLQKEAQWPVNEKMPLLTLVSRLTEQKGIHLVFEALERLLHLPWQFALLGNGDAAIEARARRFSEQHPERMVSFIKYDERISRWLYASGDIFVMPSLYEPCGLSQLFAMRYGNIPVASATGGLRDTIIDYQQDPKNATGFLLAQKSTDGLCSALYNALELYKKPAQWQKLRARAMQREFSWELSAREYAKVYDELMQKEDK